MEHKFEPKACFDQTEKNEKGEDVITPAQFSGSIAINLPTMPESFRFKAKFGKELKKTGDLDFKVEDADVDAKFRAMELVANIVEDIQKNILRVDLIHIETDTKITTVDELLCCEHAFPVLAELGMKFVTGFASKN